jgi:hypothetical protein
MLTRGSVELWDGDSIAKNPLSVDYEAIMAGDEGLKEWLYKIVGPSSNF